MKHRIFINIDTYAIGGPGKGIIQFLKYGGNVECVPLIAGFWRGPEKYWQFREAIEAVGGEFVVLRQRFAFDPAPIWNALALVRKGDFESLQSHGYKSHVVCFTLRLLTGLPWVALVHGWTTENFKIRCYYLVEKLLVRYADRIVPVSESLNYRLKLGTKARMKSIVIPNAADIICAEDETGTGESVRVMYGVQPGESLLGIVGRLSPEKGHRFLIDAMVLLRERGVKARLLIIGDGQEQQMIEKLISEHELADVVTLAGYQKDVSRFYRACDIIVMPSLTEGMPNVALEAMRFAKPLVASRVGGIPEVVLDGETGLLVEDQNPEALADALEKLISDPARMKVMGLAGSQRVSDIFDPHVRVVKLLAIHNELIEARKKD
jgi:glycosyltransferase involved in cell wall biosynthesis